MKGVDYSNDAGYADTRLRGTIVKHRDSPVYVESVDSEGRHAVATVFTLSSELRERQRVRVDDLDLTPFELGYLNYSGMACYLSRQPVRRDWRQGLRSQNMISYTGTHAHDIPNHALNPLLTNNFPSFRECMDRIAAGDSSASWNRNWAVDSEMNLLYKWGQVVGMVTTDGPQLNESSQYLREQLEESL